MSAPRIVAFLRGLSFGWILPIWAAYLSRHGVSLLELGILGSVFEFCKFGFEIPMGSLADKFGERPALLMSSLLLTITWVGLGFTHKTSILYLTMISWAFGESLYSGTYESWLSAREGQSCFGHEYSVCMQIYLAGMILAALETSFGSTHLAFIFAAIAASSEIIIYAFASFPDPQMLSEEPPLGIFDIIKRGLRESFEHVNIRKILIIAFITGFAYDGVDRFWQPLLLSRGIDIHILGPLYAAASGLSIAALYVLRKRSGWLHSSKLLRSLETSGIMAILALIFLRGWWMVATLTYLLSIEGVRNLVLKNVINSHFPNGRKATLFSIFSGFGAFGEILAGVGFGAIAGQFGLNTAFVMAAILLVPVVFYIRAGS